MKEELELYIHIPFCIKKCAYCDFLSAPAGEGVKQVYTDALLKEIKGYENGLSDAYEVISVFIGGGTPSVLTGSQIVQIVQALHRSFRFREGAEVTIEANPGTMTMEKLSAWRRAGINRLSIGLQSVEDEELKQLGRIHTWGEFLESYQMARACGFQNINIDLISAIPGQTVKSWEKTLHTVAKLRPEHISAYSLIIEEGTPFYERYGQYAQDAWEGKWPKLPDEEAERLIYERTAKVLKVYGYARYEISNYARAGYACRHNLGYWDRTQYLGIGLGASSLMGHTRYHNITDREAYISRIHQGLDIREEITSLSQAEEIEEYMFLGLRKMTGVSQERFEKLFGHRMGAVYGTELRGLAEKGLLEIDGDTVRLTERGIDLSNRVLAEFLEPAVAERHPSQ